MRQCRETGYIHNRGRMTVASFLVKDREPSSSLVDDLRQRKAGADVDRAVMLDWRWGEKWFMENLIDGDFGSKYVLPLSIKRCPKLTSGHLLQQRRMAVVGVRSTVQIRLGGMADYGGKPM